MRGKTAALIGSIMLGLGCMALPALGASATEVNARIDEVLGNHARYETMIKAFQQSVEAGHKEDVAAFVRYPIKVMIEGRKRVIAAAKAVVSAYGAIMTPDIVAAVSGQKYEDLFVNDHGVMFGNGEVWIDGVCLDRRCKRLIPQVVAIQHASAD